ncbi:FhaA domain-containing protein [Herbiconiux liangxiaofengii]|uniref:FhaA domain-containing protein n=1 Tax=Herbiconiux liangxiaofengii TaxID=3342795 RepID=UPI0035BB4C5A
MGILDNFEKGLERAVNGAFAKTFRSGLQPVEISSALKRELDTKAAVVSRDRILAPNGFRVLLASSDYQRMVGIGPTLIDDLNQIVQQHAAQQGFQFAGAVSIDLVEEPRLTTGVVQIDSANVQSQVSWTPVLDVAGRRHPITKARTIVGRGSDADITIDDTGTSRKHVEILWDGSHAQARDLGSTNGSQLNGRPFQRANLDPDSVILIGRTNIVFRIVPQSSTGQGQSPRPAAQPRGSAADPGGFWG